MELGRHRLENFLRIWKIVLEAQSSHLKKPKFGGSADWWGRAGEDVEAISENWATWAQPGHHSKQAELARVKQGASRKTASKEVYSRCWSFWVKFHQALKGDLMVMVESFELLVVEDKGGETTQEDRNAIELMHSQACSKVAMMSTGKASGENSMKGSCVGTDSSYNCGHCARCG